MNASALLSKQGWRGSGFSLDQSNRGLAKPILISRKPDGLGLGTKKDDFSNQWWLKAWDTPTSSQAPTPPSEGSSGLTAQNLTSQVPQKSALYSNFIKAGTLEGTITETLEKSETQESREAMAEMQEIKALKSEKHSKKRKRAEDQTTPGDVEASSDAEGKDKKSKKSKKEKKDKKAKKERQRDLTPAAEDVEDVFFIDTAGSATKPVQEPQKPVALAKKDKAAAMAEKRTLKLEKKLARKAGKDVSTTNDVSIDDVATSEPEDVNMDTNADFVSLGNTGIGPEDNSASNQAAQHKKDQAWAKLPRSTQKYLSRKAKRESKGKPNENDLSDKPIPEKKLPPQKEKKKKFKFLTPEEKAERLAHVPKVDKAAKYKREAAKREAKRAWKASITTPEMRAAEEELKKEQKKARREKAAAKIAAGEARKLSRNQRKAAKRAAKREARQPVATQTGANTAQVAV